MIGGRRLSACSVSLAGLAVAGMFVGATSVGPSSVPRREEPRPLDHLRSTLMSFQTVVVRNRHSISCEGPPPPRVLVRMERQSGRFTIDSLDAGWRFLWDGTQLWESPLGKVDPPMRVGAVTSEMVAELLDELLAGLPNTVFIPPDAEDWGSRYPGMPYEGTRIDLPFRWDDHYAILLRGGDQGDVTELNVLRRDTREAVHFRRIELGYVWLAFDWDVRLFPDLSDPRRLDARSLDVRDHVCPPVETRFRSDWHVDTTQNPLMLDPSSQAWETRLDRVPCTSVGQIVSMPIQLRYRVDDEYEFFHFLPDALVSGCPVRVRLEGEWTTHRRGVQTRLQADVKLLDTSVAPHAVLARGVVDEREPPPRAPTRGFGFMLNPLEFDLVPEGVLPRDFTELAVHIDGRLSVECLEPGRLVSDAKFAVRPSSRNVLSWPDCYPEMGVYPRYGTCEDSLVGISRSGPFRFRPPR